MKTEKINEAQEYLQNNVSDLIENMTIDILISKPERVVDFMMAWLEENNEKFQPKKLTKRPSGVENSSEEIGDTFEPLPEPIKNAKSQKGRTSVSAEVFKAGKKEFAPKVIKKDAEHEERIKALLQNILMFSSLELTEIKVIIDAMEEKKVLKSEVVIKQGEDGNELYIVNSGSLKCTKKNEEGEQDFLRDYLPGDYFGELALLYNTPRAATITATEDCDLFLLDRETFNHIVKTSMIENASKYEEFLKRVPLLSNLNSYETSKICDCLIIKNYKKDDVIIKEGEIGDTFYLVVEGTAVAQKKNASNGLDIEVLQYGETSYFGELALIKEEPRAATVLATSDIKCACIDRNSFKRIMGSLETIIRKNAENYVKV